MNQDCPHYFEPIDNDNRTQRLRDIMGADGEKWLGNYLDGQISRNELTSQQQAFIDAYDGLMISFLNATAVPDSSDQLVLYRFARAAADGLLDSGELSHIQSFSLLLSPNGNAQTFSDLKQNMGEELAQQWDQVAGGVLAGLVDYEGEQANGIVDRYQVTELQGMYPNRARDVVEQVNLNTMAPFLADDIIEGSIELMENFCASYTPTEKELSCRKAASR